MSDEMYITRPVNMRIFHIFNKSDNRSVCKKVMMWAVSEDNCEPYTGKENWNKGQDCKACWKKMGLKTDV